MTVVLGDCPRCKSRQEAVIAWLPMVRCLRCGETFSLPSRLTGFRPMTEAEMKEALRRALAEGADG